MPKRRNTGKPRPFHLRKKIGTWVEMDFDRVLTRNGVRWLRVKGGFGGRGDREDWVADLPQMAVSIHDYEWKPALRWGPYFYKSKAAAMDAALLRGLDHLSAVVQDSTKQLNAAKAALNQARRLIK